MRASCGDLLNMRKRHLSRCGRHVGRVDAQIAVCVVAPAKEYAVRSHRARVPEADGDADDGSDPLDLHRDRRRLRRFVAELALSSASPAVEGAE